MTRRQWLQATTAGTWLGGIAEQALAQSAALETVKIVTGFSPGGTSDSICRRVAEKIAPGYANTAFVENKTGAGGQIAIQFVKSQSADGATVLQTPMSMLGIYPHIYKKLAYEPFTDLSPVSLGCTFDFGFAVGPSVPASVKSMPDFLAWCKANPKEANYGSPAAGSVPHFVGALLGRQASIDLKHVAFRGTQPAILDMIGGQLPAVSGPVGEFTQHVTAGKCRLIATTGAQRSKFAPNTPTLVEQGLKDMVFSEWFGFYLPAKASRELVQKLNTALRSALALPDVIDGLAAMGLEAKSSTPAELASLLKADHERWGPLVKAIGFTADA
jgi:tripartite-type tricarboxylate transporter receptor subunit TctC